MTMYNVTLLSDYLDVGGSETVETLFQEKTAEEALILAMEFIKTYKKPPIPIYYEKVFIHETERNIRDMQDDECVFVYDLLYNKVE